MYRVKQRDSSDCGVASLLSIIKYYKGNISYEKLRNMMKCDKSGVSAYDLIKAAIKIGFKSYGVRCKYEDIYNIKLPCIAHITIKDTYNHFIVIEKIGTYITVNDPYYGKKKYSKIEFESIWNNIIIVLEPIKKLDNTRSNKYYINLLISNKKELIILVLISLISIILSILSTYYFKSLIDNLKDINNIFIIFSILIVIRLLIDYSRNKIMIHVDKTIDKDLMFNSFDNILSLQEEYFINRQKGDVLSRINNIDSIKTLLFKIPFLFFMYLSIVIMCSSILININIHLFLVSILVVVIYILIYIIYYKKNKHLIKRTNEENGYINGFLSETIDGINTINNYELKKRRVTTLNIIYNNYINTRNKFNELYNLEDILKNTLLLLSSNYILYLGASKIIDGSITISDLILFYSVLSMLVETLKNIFDMEEDFSNGLISISRLNEILSNDNNYGYHCNKIDTIKINNISYAYKNDNYIIKDLSLEILNNDRVIVKGSSGCGKTTLFHLILRYFNVDEGSIIVGKEEINNWNLRSIRQNITYACINDKIFRDTILNNICFYSVDLIRLNKILNIVNLNKDINTLLEENGSNLSLGERSKLILARALYKNSSVLIIDELLSNISLEEENNILEKITNDNNIKILIYTSHRDINMSLFNKILYLKEKEA